MIPADLVVVEHYHGLPQCLAHRLETLDGLEMQINVEELGDRILHCWIVPLTTCQ